MTKKISRRRLCAMLSTSPLAGTLVLGACGGEGGGSAVNHLLTVGDTMGWDRNQLTATAGAEVTVTINHTGRMAANSMGHNFVLLAQGVDMADFAAAAIAAADTDYIPAGRASEVIAHTRIVGGGESDSVTFTAPAAGTYKFLCSFPGHYASMNGDFVVS